MNAFSFCILKTLFCNSCILAILISGGYLNGKSIEAFRSDGTPLCSMADLPDYRRYHTMDGVLSCGGDYTHKSCFHYGVGGWATYNMNLKKSRQDHLSWILPNEAGVQLLGGYLSLKTSEIVSSAGIEDGFNLRYDTQ